MNEPKLVFTIYSRAECHLCEEMLEALKKWQTRFNFKIELIDIDQNASLTARFAARIPLLTVGDVEICEYFLDENALLRFLKSVG